MRNATDFRTRMSGEAFLWNWFNGKICRRKRRKKIM